MDEKTTLGFVKDTQQFLTTIYGDLAQPSVKKVGTALETVIEFCTSIMLPIKLQNEKWKLNFEKRLIDYKEKLNEIEEDKIIEVNPQIGTPILEKLSYTTNDEIADMFLNLLKNASSSDTINLAHPSFVQLIERISVDEANILKYLHSNSNVPYVTYRLKRKGEEGFIEVMKKTTLIPQNVDLIFPYNIKTYLDNLLSMGIIFDCDGKYRVDEEIYKTIYEFTNYDNLENTYKITLKDKFQELEKTKSYFELTDFGRTFIDACISKTE